MGAFFTTIFTSVFAWIAQYFTKKVAVGVGFTATYMLMTMSFYAASQLLLNGLSGLITNQWLLMGFFSVLPSNASLCLSVCAMVEVSAFIFRHQAVVLKTIAQAT